jgi:diguanylate cyclase (GGDEF)-like protein
MFKIFNTIYCLNVNNFAKDESIRIKIGNLIASLGFLVSTFYAFIYLYYFDSGLAFFLSEFFAFSYLLYFYYVSKMQLITARLIFFITFFMQMFVIVVFFASSKSGVQYYCLLAPAISYLLFQKQKKIRFIISLIALVLLMSFQFIGINYCLFEINDNVFNFLYFFSILFTFIILMLLFSIFIEEIRLREEKLVYLSKIDPLTKILNRRAFYDNSENIIKLSNRYGNEIGLSLFDIDNFKSINDSYGHDIGDYVLCELTKEVSSILRESDCFARIGGEEFVILLINISKDELEIFNEKVRKLVEEISLKISVNQEVKFTISIGSTIYKKDESFSSFLKRADIAMYKAKELGKNRVISIFDIDD